MQPENKRSQDMQRRNRAANPHADDSRKFHGGRIQQLMKQPVLLLDGTDDHSKPDSM